MPWRETWVMDEKVRFVAAASEEEAVMSELCVEFGISRQTGYKWLQRYRAEGLEGLKDRSRAPNRHGRAREEELVAAALGLRERQPTWGPKKLRRKLSERWPDLSTPAISTIGDWLRKEGLTQSRRPRRRCPPFASPFQAVEAPNAVWCADFKGWFRTGEGKRCDPLTISDAMSRYLLRCEAVAQPDGDCVRDAFDAAFCEFGLPLAIRSDNGPPFASVGAGGLSRLSVWWIKLGVRPERIDPGKPQQNGRHERLHRTLKEDAASPPKATLAEQQRAFDVFRAVYNHERPHEALDFATPASLYCASPRAYPCALREPDYPDEAAVRRVRTNGCIKWAGDLVFVSEALIGEPVAVEETEEGERLVRYGDVELGFIDKNGRLRRRKLEKPRRACGLVDNAARCPQVHRSDSRNSNRLRKWPKVSAMYPVRCVNDRSAGWGMARRRARKSDCKTDGANLHRTSPAFRTPSGPSGHLPRFAEKGKLVDHPPHWTSRAIGATCWRWRFNGLLTLPHGGGRRREGGSWSKREVAYQRPDGAFQGVRAGPVPGFRMRDARRLHGCRRGSAEPGRARSVRAARRRQHGRRDARGGVGRRRARRPFRAFQPEPR